MHAHGEGISIFMGNFPEAKVPGHVKKVTSSWPVYFVGLVR